MPTADELKQMAAWLAGTDIGLLELRTPHGVVRLGREPAAGDEIVQLEDEALDDEAAPAQAIAGAPSVGVFLHAHPLHNKPVVRVGERVKAGQGLGLVRIGPLLLPVTAPAAGLVTGVREEVGAAVGYGTALFELHID
ncbi:biotin/lipoyl-containing protein [Variovorax sp. Sphag1AA]|uniref:acetyl-CoA carboxylase biotin carboxyl carrier protein n=1 Tax=Variovorax sp. Sphag1AA TaxID=2587027 RepID=UPI00161C9476|nr:biotin/lipoyl-containing protein [Variovorax sp. Sphag1AA]MBB3178090.1 acetyl-CoA carboxylase biotin carboxyl carrier protein [Variovorax sp. Sphag1AA]